MQDNYDCTDNIIDPPNFFISPSIAKYMKKSYSEKDINDLLDNVLAMIEDN